MNGWSVHEFLQLERPMHIGPRPCGRHHLYQFVIQQHRLPLVVPIGSLRHSNSGIRSFTLAQQEQRPPRRLPIRKPMRMLTSTTTRCALTAVQSFQFKGPRIVSALTQKAPFVVALVAYGNCAARMLLGLVPPTFTRIGSRSLFAPVYRICPSMSPSNVE